MFNKYDGSWANFEEMQKEFYLIEKYDWMPPSNRDHKIQPKEDKDVIYANYHTESYEGTAWVLFKCDGVLYEVCGSHCSCNGLEECWSPEATTYTAIVARPTGYSYPMSEEFRKYAMVCAAKERVVAELTKNKED